MKNKLYAVIMAGGQGTRLWPLSRVKKPKQLQALASEKTMIRETFERLLPKYKPEDIFVSTTLAFVEDIKKALPELSKENFLVEPFLMGTAAACGLVSKILNLRDENSSVIFLPSDQLINNKAEFIEVLDFAEQLITKHPDHVLTIGINPTRPDVGLGYIQMNEQLESEKDLKAFTIKRFVEKPDLKTAQKYLASWEYLWNAGIFIWKTKTILDLFQKNLPKTYNALEKIGKSIGKENEKKVLETEYAKVEVTTIDYGIMEKTKKILVIPADFGWSDVGSWGTLLEVLSKAHGTDVITRGHHIGVDNANCLILGGEKLIATVGLKDIVVIDTPDAILICNSKESHKVKDLLNKFKEEGKHLYL